MIQNIWKQLWNRRKKNRWIALELLLIFCLIWYMVDFFFVLSYNISQTSHRDINNCYMLQMATLSENHPEYNEQEAEPNAGLANFRRIINRIKEHPDIESVTIVPDYSCLPETGSMNRTEYRTAEDTTKKAEAQFIRFLPEEDYLSVFRHTTDNGKKPISVADFTWSDPSHILISRMLEKKLFPGESAIGKTIERTYSTPEFPREQYRIIGIIDDFKQIKYGRPNASIFYAEQINESNYHSMIISFRIKEGYKPAQFIRTFKKEMSSQLRIGNYYLQNLSAFTDIANDLDYRTGTTNMIRLRIGMMLFLLISISLCILGTFWHRVNVRREEIGIRRAMGSKISDIGKLFILEGLLLLTLITPIAMITEAQFVFAGIIETVGVSEISYGNYLPDHTIIRFLITNTITWLFMAVIVILAIYYPAHSASRINPVDALRDE